MSFRSEIDATRFDRQGLGRPRDRALVGSPLPGDCYFAMLADSSRREPRLQAETTATDPFPFYGDDHDTSPAPARQPARGRRGSVCAGQEGHPAPAVERRAPPRVKELVSLKLDSDVLAYFQEDGPGWPDRINDALREAMNDKG